MTWQEAISADPEARHDFADYLTKKIAAAGELVFERLRLHDIEGAQAANARRQVFVDLQTMFTVDEREADQHANFRRLAAARR